MLAYSDIGTGIPIILIHGLGSRKEVWAPQYPLSKKYRLITPDLRGHGETVEEDNIRLRTFAKDVLELMNFLQIESAVIGGLSLGGIIAQEIYKQAPNRVIKLILSNTTSYINPLFVQGLMCQTEKRYRNKKFISEIVDRGLYNWGYAEQAKEGFLIRDSYMDSFRAPIGMNYFPTLLAIRVPVLLIGSSQDKVTPLPNMYLMDLFIANSQKEVFHNCGHLSNIENSGLFNYLIDNFIEGGK